MPIGTALAGDDLQLCIEAFQVQGLRNVLTNAANILVDHGLQLCVWEVLHQRLCSWLWVGQHYVCLQHKPQASLLHNVANSGHNTLRS